MAAHSRRQRPEAAIVETLGTKVKSIRLVGGDHEVDCRMDGGSFVLKACYLKKV